MSWVLIVLVFLILIGVLLDVPALVDVGLIGLTTALLTIVSYLSYKVVL